MKPGTQIAYIPAHAKGNIKHKDVEFGFVTSETRDAVGNPACFCRFWHRGEPGVLRTVSNSQFVKGVHLIEHQSVAQSAVDAVMEVLLSNYGFYKIAD